MSKSKCAKIFERMVFGYKRGKGWGFEGNTKQEDALFLSVDAWIADGQIYSDTVKNLEKIKNCINHYPNELKPSVKEIWRGISVVPERALKWLPYKKLKESKDVLKIGSLTYVGLPMRYKPGKQVESWAAEPAVATRFAMQGTVAKWLKSNAGDMEYVTEKVEKYIKRRDRNSKGFDEQKHIKEIRETIDMFYKSLTVWREIPLIFTMKTDKNCLFSEWFANALSIKILDKKESEVTRVTRNINVTTPATIYIPKVMADNMIRYENVVDEVVAKIPKLKGVPRFE